MTSFEKNTKGQIIKRDVIPAREEISIIDKVEYLLALNNRKAALAAEIVRVEAEIASLETVPDKVGK